MKTPCHYCGIDLKLDLTDPYSQANYRKICIHVWMHHDETNYGIALKETLSEGPTVCE